MKLLKLIFILLFFCAGIIYPQAGLEGIYCYDYPEEDRDFWGVYPERVSEKFNFFRDGSFNYEITGEYSGDSCGSGN